MPGDTESTYRPVVRDRAVELALPMLGKYTVGDTGAWGEGPGLERMSRQDRLPDSNEPETDVLYDVTLHVLPPKDTTGVAVMEEGTEATEMVMTWVRAVEAIKGDSAVT